MSDEPVGVFESRKGGGGLGGKKGGGLGALLGMALMMKGTLGALGKLTSFTLLFESPNWLIIV